MLLLLRLRDREGERGEERERGVVPVLNANVFISANVLSREF